MAAKLEAEKAEKAEKEKSDGDRGEKRGKKDGDGEKDKKVFYRKKFKDAVSGYTMEGVSLSSSPLLSR